MSINTPSRRKTAAALGFIIAVLSFIIPSGIVLIPVALISLCVALYFDGPTDAKSFRLYRKPAAATAETA
jgi:hypothetical protein